MDISIPYPAVPDLSEYVEPFHGFYYENDKPYSMFCVILPFVKNADSCPAGRILGSHGSTRKFIMDLTGVDKIEITQYQPPYPVFDDDEERDDYQSLPAKPGDAIVKIVVRENIPQAHIRLQLATVLVEILIYNPGVFLRYASLSPAFYYLAELYFPPGTDIWSRLYGFNRGLNPATFAPIGKLGSIMFPQIPSVPRNPPSGRIHLTEGRIVDPERKDRYGVTPQWGYLQFLHSLVIPRLGL